MQPLTPTPLTLGDLAYLDTMRGLIPVKVIAAGIVASSGDAYMTWRVTADRPGYSRGETACVWASSGNRFTLVPRSSVYCRNGHYRIANDWHWIVDGTRFDTFATTN